MIKQITNMLLLEVPSDKLKEIYKDELYKLDAFLNAGLIPTGFDEDGEVQWLGNGTKFSKAWKEIENYETFND